MKLKILLPTTTIAALLMSSVIISCQKNNDAPKKLDLTNQVEKLSNDGSNFIPEKEISNEELVKLDTQKLEKLNCKGENRSAVINPELKLGESFISHFSFNRNLRYNPKSSSLSSNSDGSSFSDFSEVEVFSSDKVIETSSNRIVVEKKYTYNIKPVLKNPLFLSDEDNKQTVQYTYQSSKDNKSGVWKEEWIKESKINPEALKEFTDLTERKKTYEMNCEYVKDLTGKKTNVTGHVPFGRKLVAATQVITELESQFKCNGEEKVFTRKIININSSEIKSVNASACSSSGKTIFSSFVIVNKTDGEIISFMKTKTTEAPLY